MSPLDEQEFPTSLVKPKEEPIDDSESNTSQKYDDSNMDSLDSKSGEASQWQSPTDLGKNMDSSTPGEYSLVYFCFIYK